MTVTLTSDRAACTDCVLVVDDEPVVLEAIAEILSSAGHHVVTAGSVQDAMRIVQEQDIAVVLADINLSGRLSGLDLIDAMHALRPSLPIIPVTGFGDESTLREALDRGVAGFITKPVVPDELHRKVDAALSRLLLTEVELRERLLAPTVASVLANAIEVRDSSMEGHTERLASLALEIGRRKGVSDVDLETLAVGAVLHDIGKIGIPDSILLKPGAITVEERTAIQAHTVIGDRMLAPLALLEPVRPIVRHHHERWDGDGYPDRLEGEAIPLLARIVAVADSVEAMSGPRPYRRPLGRDDVVRQLRQGRARQWDPELTDIALDLIESGRIRFGAAGISLLTTPR